MVKAKFFTSIVTLSITLTLTLQAKAQEACDITFIKGQNRQERLDQLSSELAELIHQKEMALHTTQVSLLRKTIHLKMQELLNAFSDSEGSRQILQNEVELEIKRHLQKLKDEDFKKEASSRRGESEVKNELWTKSPLYRLTGSQTFKSTVENFKFDFIESTESFLVSSGGEVKMFNPQADSLIALPERSRLAEVVDKGQTILAFTSENKIILLDAKTMNVLKQASPDLRNFIKRSDGGDFSNLAISPNKRFVAIGSVHGTVIVVDFETGKIVGEATNKLGNFTSWIKTVQFVSNSEILFNGDQVIRIFDFLNQKTREVKLAETAMVFGAALSADRSVITVSQFKNVVSYSVANLNQIVDRSMVYPDRAKLVAQYSEGGSQTAVMKAIPNDLGHVFMLGNGTPQDFGIYSVHQLGGRVFDFEESYQARGDHELKNISFSPDKQRMFALVRAAGQARIDIWQLR